MFREKKYKIKFKNSPNNQTQFIANQESNKYNFKYYSPQKILPSINNNKDKKIYSKIKRSPLSKTINYLYKTLFPEEKSSMDELVNNFTNKHIFKKPVWKYTYLPYKDEEKIKHDLMTKNTVMKYYNIMKIPTKLKRTIKYKPRMVQIIEDNIIYKNRAYDNNYNNNYFDESYFLNSNKSSLLNGKNSSINLMSNINENFFNDEEKNINNSAKKIDIEKIRNKINISKLYGGNSDEHVINKTKRLSPIDYDKISEEEEKNIFKHIILKRKKNEQKLD